LLFIVITVASTLFVDGSLAEYQVKASYYQLPSLGMSSWEDRGGSASLVQFVKDFLCAALY